MWQYKPKFVRLGTKSADEFTHILTEKSNKIQESFLNNIKNLTKTITVKAMLGDSSVIEQQTFDPESVTKYYRRILNNLPEWTSQGVSITNNEDLRRIFLKFEIKEGNYLLSGHLSLQFHVLLYYKPVHRVIEFQKELSEIMDKTKDAESQITEIGDKLILEKLKNLGYSDLDHQQLFEIFFENDELRDKIYNDIQSKTDINFQSLPKRKTQLFNELDNLLIETYQTTPVLIDDRRLISGEEGCVCSFDLEYIKNKIREGVIDPKKISKQTKQKLIQRMDQVLLAIV